MQDDLARAKWHRAKLNSVLQNYPHVEQGENGMNQGLAWIPHLDQGPIADLVPGWRTVRCMFGRTTSSRMR